jgi:predicted regulator of Ras-like GTPase activity (Roadblock/LC7/MglB family)
MSSPIQESLVELRHAPGVKGAALVTADGLIAASSLDARFRDDVIAGLTSFLIMTTEKALQEVGMPSFMQFSLHATHGKAVIVDLEGSYLIVLLDQFADVDRCRDEIQGAAQGLRRSSHLS